MQNETALGDVTCEALIRGTPVNTRPSQTARGCQQLRAHLDALAQENVWLTTALEIQFKRTTDMRARLDLFPPTQSPASLPCHRAQRGRAPILSRYPTSSRARAVAQTRHGSPPQSARTGAQAARLRSPRQPVSRQERPRHLSAVPAFRRQSFAEGVDWSGQEKRLPSVRRVRIHPMIFSLPDRYRLCSTLSTDATFSAERGSAQACGPTHQHAERPARI